MTNLDLHNKLVHIAKETQRLKEKHPEIQADLAAIEETLRLDTAATPAHQPILHPYRKPVIGAS